ncbi:MAG: aminotransferase class I/II-fold pyridoxal phosphate-dependent enzyme [Candidatus Lokiarchaeota archaeon]|nr:aminotransferase class I/II-fold pyridoxal phosphate-dependent enzyme [Candidatus Lokiarchaeota archaeon]
MVKIADRVKTLEYAIRDVTRKAREIQINRRVHWLNIGDPCLFDFKTPKYIIEALAKAAYDGKNYYADSLGVAELRRLIIESERKKSRIDIPLDNIIITSGVSEGIMFTAGTLVQPGLEMLLPGPCYSTYISYCKFFGGKGVEYRLAEEDDWNPDIDDFRNKITDKTNAIMVSSPNNPTGKMYKKKTMKEIVDIAGEYDLPVISDEIYDKIVYDGEFTHPASLTKDVPVIGMNGFSKAHMSTGWRLGYLYFYDPENKVPEIKENIEKLARSRLCANTPAQYAAIEAFKRPRNYTKTMVKKLEKRRDYTYKRIKEIEHIDCIKPDGAFYMFPKIELNGLWKDDKEFVLDVLENTGVCFVYGSGFGDYGKDHFRTTFLPPIADLGEVYEKLETYMKAKEK